MRKVWFSLIVLAVSTPLALVALLLAAVQFPALDGLTLAMPQGVRSTVASVAIGMAGGDASQPKIERALKLDSGNPEAWAQLCSLTTSPKVQPAALRICARASELDPTSGTWTSLGLAQEDAGDFCGAEKSYAFASSSISDGGSDNSRSLGRTMLLCGKFEAGVAVAELQIARARDGRDPANDDSEDDLKTDREWLSVAYASEKAGDLAKESCVQAHPEFKTAKSCSCTLKDHQPVCFGQ